MRDRRRLAGRKHAGGIVRTFLDRSRIGRAAANQVLRVRKRVGQLMDENQLRVADADHVAGL